MVEGLGLAAVTMLGLVVLMGATGGKGGGVAEEIRAKGFILVDTNGTTRAHLKTSGGMVALALMGQGGEVRSSLFVTPDGQSAMVLHNQNREPLVMLRTVEDGRMTLVLSNHGISMVDEAKGQMIWQAP